MLEFFILSLFWYAAPAINLRYTSNTSTLEIEEEEDDWSKERKKQKRINIGAGGYWRDVIRTIMVGNAHDQDSTHDQQLRLTTVTQRYRRIQRLHESFKIGRYENLSLLEGQLKVYKLQRNCNCNNAPKFPELQVSLIREFGTHKLLPDSDSPPPRRPIPLTFMKLDPHTTHNSQSSLPTPLRSTETQKPQSLQLPKLLELKLQHHQLQTLDLRKHHAVDRNFEFDSQNSIAFLMRTLAFGWYVVRSGSKNGYQNDMCSKEIGACAQLMITI